MNNETKYIYWQDNKQWICYLELFQDYWTQDETLSELEENLLDLCKDLTGGYLSQRRRSATLKIA